MPKYEYSCTFCDNVVEVERKMSEPELIPKCYLCESPTKRIYGVSAAHFKGQGWGGVYRNHKPKRNDG